MSSTYDIHRALKIGSPNLGLIPGQILDMDKLQPNQVQLSDKRVPENTAKW